MYLVSAYGQGQSEVDNFMTNTTAASSFLRYNMSLSDLPKLSTEPAKIGQIILFRHFIKKRFQFQLKEL